jgi:hypoxanthine phosphoribosyltransferase
MEKIKVLLTDKQIQQRVDFLAKKISKDYKNKKLVVIAVLKGSIIFVSDLLRNLTVDCTLDFVSVASYKGRKSSGTVRLLMDLRENPQNKHLLIVDEIVDSGHTLGYLTSYLKAKKPASIRTCALIDKHNARKVPVKADYYGFKIPNKFVVGYGLDYNEKYRNLPYIGILKSKGE